MIAGVLLIAVSYFTGQNMGNSLATHWNAAGEADGFGGTVAVEVTVKDGKIEVVEVTSAEKEDSAYLAMAEDIIPTIIEAQSADVDTISGATFSSTGIKNASEQALEKAVK